MAWAVVGRVEFPMVCFFGPHDGTNFMAESLVRGFELDAVLFDSVVDVVTKIGVDMTQGVQVLLESHLMALYKSVRLL
jgi:hypothetical protein